MKRILITLAALVILVTGCDKEVPLDQELKTLNPVSIDEDAKTWNLMLVVNMATEAPCRRRLMQREAQAFKQRSMQ